MSEAREVYASHNKRAILETEARAGYVRVLDPRTGKFLFEYDAERNIVVWRERGARIEVHLSQYK